MKGLYRMDVSVGRMGDLEALFVADKRCVEILIKEQIGVYFGEVLGKHSEVYGTIKPSEISLVTDDKNVIDVIEKYNLETGHNPLYKQHHNIDFEELGIEEKVDGEWIETVDEVIEQIIKRDEDKAIKED